jgi:hypothetical protein
LKANAARQGSCDDAPEAGRRVLLLFPGALGDAVCLEPAASHLASCGELTLYARGAAAEVAALYPQPPHVRSLDAPEVARLFAPDEDDRAVSAWLAGFERIVSFTGAALEQVARRLRETGRATLAPFPRAPSARHASDYFLGVASGDERAVSPPPRLLLHGDEGEESVAGPARLAVLPGSGGPAKRAAPELFQEVARRWRGAGGDVTVILGPAESGEEQAWGEVGVVRRPASIRELARVLDRCAAFVGNDAGSSHVAAALGVAGAVLYRATSPAAFGPRGRDVVAVHVAGEHRAASDAAWHAVCGRLP